MPLVINRKPSRETALANPIGQCLIRTDGARLPPPNPPGIPSPAKLLEGQGFAQASCRRFAIAFREVQVRT